jgi:hypothetical protein
MAGSLIILFLAMVVIDIWAAIRVMFRPGLAGWLGVSYWVGVILALVATVWMTGFFSYYTNPNTHVFGWPIPRVIFQRDTPDSPWLDFIGPTIILAYPINLVVFLFVPSLICILLSRRQKHETRNEV